MQGAMSDSDYQAWLDRIYAELRVALGGEPDQTGSSRRYGNGLFGHGMAAKPSGDMGNVVFQVTRRDDPLHRMTTVGPSEWYAHPDVTIVVKRLLEAFENIDP
jgi:hypothetical protein